VKTHALSLLGTKNLHFAHAPFPRFSANENLAKNTRINEKVTLSKVSLCDVCAEDLSDVPCTHHERRTKIDIIFEKVVEHVDAEVKQCPTCEATVKGQFPADMPGPLQYGDGLKAFMINLLVCQMVSLNRVQKLVRSLIGVVIAEATLLKFVFRLNQALAAWELQATEQILKAPTIHVDESVPRRRAQKVKVLQCSYAAQEMRVGPSESPYRRRLQTTYCCCV